MFQADMAPRIDPKTLQFLSLMTLEEVAAQAHDEPIRPSWGVRLALAYLYALGVGQKWHHDQFWKAVIGPTVGGGTETISTYIRHTHMGTMLDLFYRELGVERTWYLMDRGAEGSLRGGVQGRKEQEGPWRAGGR